MRAWGIFFIIIMKKTILSLALMLISLAVSAQTIKTDFKKGDVRKYSTSMDLNFGVPMQGEMKGSATVLTTYTVTDAGNGWTVVMKVDSFYTTGSEEIVGQFSNENNFMGLKKTPAILKLDAKGYITDIVNSDDVLAAIAEVSINSLNNIYSKHPELEKMAPKSKAMLKINDELTKDNLLKFVRESSVLALNGKDIKPGKPFDETLMDDILKTKGTFSLSKDADGLTVVGKKSESNMTEDDVKQLLKKQMANFGASADDTQFDLVWGQLKSMGMANLEYNSEETSTFNNDGWLKSETSNGITTLAGAKIKISETTTLK